MGAVVRIFFTNQGPKLLGMIEMDGMAKLVDKDVVHQFGGQKQQLGIKTNALAARATGPARFLATNRGTAVG